jgi:hypothetical protein
MASADLDADSVTTARETERCRPYTGDFGARFGTRDQSSAASRAATTEDWT